YLYKLASLGRMLTGPAAFKPKVHTVAPSSYLSLDQADITSMPAARAVAVLGKLKGPNPQAEVLSKEWLRDFAPTLAAQDALPGFRARLAGSSTPKRSPPGPSSAPPPPAARRLLLFVKDNQASRNAYKLARHMMAQDRTQLTLVHVVGPAASMTSGEALLASFTDVLTNDQTRRKVVQQRSVVPSGALCADLLSHGGGWRLQSERLMESLLSEVALLDPLLVILGSEALSSPSASSSASVGLQLAKSLFDCSLVIVKNNSCGDLFHAQDKAGHETGMVVAAEVQCRPHGLDKGSMKEGLATTRMMAAFEAEALAGRVPRHAVARVPLANGLLEGLPPVVLQHKCDLLALVGPSAKVTPPHILDLLRTCPCNIMVWRPSGPPQAPTAPCSSQAATQPAASEPGPSSTPPAKRTKAEQAAEPT
ncbi:hypothetical protein QJQ45_023231, partial [Haematococcus lacustris]